MQHCIDTMESPRWEDSDHVYLDELEGVFDVIDAVIRVNKVRSTDQIIVIGKNKEVE